MKLKSVNRVHVMLHFKLKEPPTGFLRAEISTVEKTLNFIILYEHIGAIVTLVNVLVEVFHTSNVAAEFDVNVRVELEQQIRIVRYDVSVIKSV